MTAKPTPISEGMFNALPDVGPGSCRRSRARAPPTPLGSPPDLVIGSVFQVHTDKGPQHYVVLHDGVAQVNATTAAALRATQSHGLVAPPAVVPSLVVRIPERVYHSPLPDEPLKMLSPAGRADAVLDVGAQSRRSGAEDHGAEPVGTCRYRRRSMNAGIKQIHGHRNRLSSDGGKFVTLQSPDPRYGESLYYVDPQGVRYGLPDADDGEGAGAGIARRPRPGRSFVCW